jgi:hypothetical protein
MIEDNFGSESKPDDRFDRMDVGVLTLPINVLVFQLDDFNGSILHCLKRLQI